MRTKSSSELGEVPLAGDGLDETSSRLDERLRQLCHGIIQVLSRETPRDDAAFRAVSTLRSEAGQILVPHLEAGLRSLAGALRDDLFVRMSNLQLVERLSGLENDPSSISRMFRGEQAEPLATPGPSEPLLDSAPKQSDAAFKPEQSVLPALAEDGSLHLANPSPTEAPAKEWVFDAPLVLSEAEQSPPVADARALTTERETGTEDSGSQGATSSEDEASVASAEDVPSKDYLHLAANCWQRGDQEEALAACSRALQFTATDASAYLLRGRMHSLRGEHDRAVEDFTSAVELRPGHAEAYLRRGNTFLELGQQDRAVEDYSAAVELQPNLAVAHLNRALVYANQKAWREAVADAGSVIRIKPDCGSAYFVRGSAYFELGEAQHALADLNRLLQIDPKNALAYNNRGLVRASLREYKEALADYERALRLKPRFMLARYNRALALFHQGELDRALDAFNELIQFVPDNEMAFYQRGLIHRARHDPERAVADFARALEIQPQFTLAEESLRKVRQLTGARRRELSAPQAGLDTKIDFEPIPANASQDAPSTRVEATAPSEQQNAEDQELGASQEKEETKQNFIRLICKECGASSQVRIDRLFRKFQCRKCRRVYAVQNDGQLTELLPRRKPSDQLKALAWKGLRLSPLAALILVLVVGGRYAWRNFNSGPSLPSLPHELEPRAEMLTKAWLNQDTHLIELLTTSAQEDRVQAWLKANPSPVPTDKLKVSRNAIRQTKVDIVIIKERRDVVRLRIQVNNPLSSPVHVEQEWVREGNTWYFRPFPEMPS